MNFCVKWGELKRIVINADFNELLCTQKFSLYVPLTLVIFSKNAYSIRAFESI